MFVSSLLQLSKSGAHLVQDRYASIKGFKDNDMDATGKGFKDNKMGNGSKRNDESDVRSEINRVIEQSVKPKELDKDILEDPVWSLDSPPGCLERAAYFSSEQRGRYLPEVRRKNDEAHQKHRGKASNGLAEHQLQKLTDNTNHYALPPGTKICALTSSLP
ncbi:33 kDa chaperonin [Striga asiatica]|uniref:33 kDa chaperonin n=1 Tax=Striga asiatica TaxID=4170 RepID=A0A5A7PGS3_STRAF|nr:33 kDa chaperonin [Striga asiatica]